MTSIPNHLLWGYVVLAAFLLLLGHLILSHIRRCVEFSTPYFQVIRKKDGKVIPGLSVGKLSRYLAKALTAKGTTVPTVIAEDFGPLLVIRRKPFPSSLWVACYKLDDPATRWRVIVKAEYAWIARLFGVKPRQEVATIESQLREIIASIPDVSAIEWKNR
jgi:hypothetical protein